MSFEKYRDSVIEDFIEDMKLCNTMKNDSLSDKQIKAINEKFEEHRHCYEHKDEFDQECDLDMILSTIYGNNQSAAIECNNCNNIIIDDQVLN